MRALLAIMAARESERDEAEKVVCDLLWWAEQKCPCENEEPNPCTLCGASVENLEGCKAADETLPRSWLYMARAVKAKRLSRADATPEDKP